MKTLTAKQFSAIITSLLTADLLFFLLTKHFFEIGWLALLMGVILLSIITYFVVSFLLKKSYNKQFYPASVTIQNPPTKKKKTLLSEDEDIDVEKWTKKQIKELERLKDLERYRKEFVGNVSHELKTPIFNIQGYILTLLEGGIEDPNINKLYLQRTEKSIDRMISIVEDLESITRLESGELKLRFETFNIVKLVEDVFELEQMLANELKINLEIEDKPSRPIMVHADKKKIIEVLSNLVLNAIKYGKRKGTVGVSFLDSKDKIVVEVKDDGIGIDKKDLPRIFERFFRVDKSRSREQGGTGLGLSIVKHIIEAHGQVINVKSESNVGTTFTFSLDKAKKLSKVKL